jgi:hypothetical protein
MLVTFSLHCLGLVVPHTNAFPPSDLKRTVFHKLLLAGGGHTYGELLPEAVDTLMQVAC